MTHSGETEIEMVLRHIREGEKNVAAQREIVTRFPPDSDVAETAYRLLTLFEETLDCHRQHLARLLR